MSEELNEIEEIDEVQEEEVKNYDFPEGAVFYDRIIETDTYKCLGNV